MDFPRHAGGMYITHNEHKSFYQTAETWVQENADSKFGKWISEEQRAIAIASDSIWMVQWFPDTPGGFCARIGATLDAVLEAIHEEQHACDPTSST